MNTLEEMGKRLEENERQAEEKERQAKEMEAEAVINQIKSDIDKIKQISQRDDWGKNMGVDYKFVDSKRREYYTKKYEAKYAWIRKEDIAKIIVTYDAGEVHKKSMAEDEEYAESVRTTDKIIGRSYNPSGLKTYESELLGIEDGHTDFFLQNILSLSEPDFIHYVDNLYRKNKDGTEDRDHKIVLKPETIKRFNVLRENKELANQLIEVIETAFEKWSQNLNKERVKKEKKEMILGLTVIGVVIAIIVAIIVKCVA